MTARDMLFAFGGYALCLACACFKWWRANRVDSRRAVASQRTRAERDINCYHRGVQAQRQAEQTRHKTRRLLGVRLEGNGRLERQEPRQ